MILQEAQFVGFQPELQQCLIYACSLHYNNIAHVLSITATTKMSSHISVFHWSGSTHTCMFHRGSLHGFVDPIFLFQCPQLLLSFSQESLLAEHTSTIVHMLSCHQSEHQTTHNNTITYTHTHTQHTVTIHCHYPYLWTISNMLLDLSDVTDNIIASNSSSTT